MPAVSWANFHPEGQGGVILRAIYPQPRRLTREQAMPLDDLRLIIIEYVARGGQLLVNHSEQDLDDCSTLPGAELKVDSFRAAVIAQLSTFQYLSRKPWNPSDIFKYRSCLRSALGCAVC